MKKPTDGITIIVPTLNEAGNVKALLERLHAALLKSGIRYEVVCIDDHSTDSTVSRLISLKKYYPLRTFSKAGERGKAYSLLQGVKQARYETICMIDADLQYPPEAIVPMYERMQKSGAALVVTRRQAAKTSLLRRMTSSGFNYVFCRLLFGVHYDTQSGLKLCRKDLLEGLRLNPSPWSFDLELVVRAQLNGHKVASYDIPFTARVSEQSKAKVLGVSYELAKSSLRLKYDILRSKLVPRKEARE